MLGGLVARGADISTENRSALERIALAKARGDVADRVYALRLDEQKTVGDWAAQDLARDRTLRLWLRRLPAHGTTRLYSDGSCDLSVRLEPSVLSDKLSEIQKGGAANQLGAFWPDFNQVAKAWPVLWGLGAASRVEQKGICDVEGWEDLTSEGLDVARRAAEADARQALLEAIGDLPITRTRPVSAFLQSSVEVRAAAEAALQHAATVEVSFAPDQVALATARISVLELISILAEVYESAYRGQVFLASDFRGMGLLTTVDLVTATGMAVPPPAVSLARSQIVEADAPSWAAAKMTAVGRYVPAEAGELAEAAQIEAARRDGLDQLRQGVDQLVLRDGVTVSDFLATHQRLQDDVLIFLSGVRAAVPAGGQPGGVVEVQVELPLRRLWRIVRSGMEPVESEELAPSSSQPTESGAHSVKREAS